MFKILWRLNYTEICLLFRFVLSSFLFDQLTLFWVVCFSHQVEGLCGNFDGDQGNDFSTPQGGPPAVQVTTFADSWQVNPDLCVPSKTVTDTCKQNPEREQWAKSKCSIISSSLFEPCRSVMPDYLAYQSRWDKTEKIKWCVCAL